MKQTLRAVTALAFACGVIGTTAYNAEAATTDNTTLNIGINPGALTITAPAVTTPFAPVNLNGDVQKTNATLGAFQVGDATGNAVGYTVTARASQFAETTQGTLKLPTSSLTMKAPTAVTATTTTTSAAPAIQANSPWIIDSGSAVTVLSADANQGMGMYQATMPVNTLELTLKPESTKTIIGQPTTSYDSVVTWTIAPL